MGLLNILEKESRGIDTKKMPKGRFRVDDFFIYGRDQFLFRDPYCFCYNQKYLEYLELFRKKEISHEEFMKKIRSDEVFNAHPNLKHHGKENINPIGYCFAHIHFHVRYLLSYSENYVDGNKYDRERIARERKEREERKKKKTKRRRKLEPIIIPDTFYPIAKMVHFETDMSKYGEYDTDELKWLGLFAFTYVYKKRRKKHARKK